MNVQPIFHTTKFSDCNWFFCVLNSAYLYSPVRGTCAPARQEEELEYLRVKLEKEKETRSRAIDKALMERELEAVKKQACAARTTVEVTLGTP